MRRNNWVGVALALSLFLAPTGSTLADESDVDMVGGVEAYDVNQGVGNQINGDNWEDINNALSGSGNQSADIGSHANTGSGAQDNSFTDAEEWEMIDNANAGSGAQVVNSNGSAGRDRTSDDVVLNMGAYGAVANSALSSQVSGNTVSVSGGGESNSGMSFGNGSGFAGMYGVNAIALNSGANASQNVSVNVTASVATSAPAGSTSVGSD